MISDASLLLADNVQLNQIDLNLHNVGNVIDITNLRNIGSGLPPLYLVVLVTQAITGGAGATVQFSFVSDSRNPPGTDGNQNVHYLSAAIPVATLVAGYVAALIALPQEGVAYAEFLGLQAQAGTADLTAGSIAAFFTKEPDNWKAYPAAVYFN